MASMTARLGSDSSGAPVMEFSQHDTFTAETAAEIFEQTIRRGMLSQVGLAETIRAELRARGHKYSDQGKYSRSHFNEAVGDPDSYLYEAVDLVDIILSEQMLTWLLVFWAASSVMDRVDVVKTIGWSGGIRRSSSRRI